MAIEHHGDQEFLDFWEGLPQDMKGKIYIIRRNKVNIYIYIYIEAARKIFRQPENWKEEEKKEIHKTRCEKETSQFALVAFIISSTMSAELERVKTWKKREGGRILLYIAGEGSIDAHLHLLPWINAVYGAP